MDRRPASADAESRIVSGARSVAGACRSSLRRAEGTGQVVFSPSSSSPRSLSVGSYRANYYVSLIAAPSHSNPLAFPSVPFSDPSPSPTFLTAPPSPSSFRSYSSPPCILPRYEGTAYRVQEQEVRREQDEAKIEQKRRCEFIGPGRKLATRMTSGFTLGTSAVVSMAEAAR